MTLDIVPYGHPALRAKGRRIENVDARIRALANEMLETMYAAEGVGPASRWVCPFSFAATSHAAIGRYFIAGQAVDRGRCHWC